MGTDAKHKTLERRLREAEDTLYAIRSGEVDAVVVDGPAGQQIYTLESPDQPFRVFVEQMQEGALTLNSNGTIIYCNRFFADLVGRPLEQVRGQPILQFIASDSEHFHQLFAAAGEGVVHEESWIYGPEGSEIPVQIAVNPLPPEDLRMFGMVVTDLSERERAKRLEAERMAAEEANAARDQFLAVVSHELRTPLNAIIGWTQVLRRQKNCSDRVMNGLEVIERSAWNQAQLIDDLLDVSRVLAGKLRLDLNPVSVVQTVKASTKTIMPSAAAKKIRVNTRALDQELIVCGDSDRLQQIVTNLLTNAVKFTPEDGTVQIKLWREGELAYVEVSDNGIGIPAEFLPCLFNLYQQIEGSTTRKNGGLGLGLAIVKELTEMHGGTVSAHSAGEGQGATFTVTLPILEEDVGAETTPTSHQQVSSVPSLANVRVLVVEDDPIARDVLIRVLDEVQAKVTAVTCADEALRFLETQSADILVSDIGLPGMDGYELIKQVRRADLSGRALPAIALTAFAGREDRRLALLAGYQVHLPKPVDQTELCAVIANLTGVVQQS